MFFERLRPAVRTLRFQLIVWNAAVVLLTSLGILLGVREGLRFSLLSEMDQILRQDIIEIGLAVKEQRLNNLSVLHEQLNRKARGHDQDGWFVQFRDRRDAILFSSENTPTEPLQPGTPSNSPPGYRLLRDTLVTADGARITVLVGASSDFLYRDMQRIDRIAILIVAAMLVVAPLGGYLLATKATKPMADITYTMARLRPAQLHERLALRHTGDELDQLSNSINKLLDRLAEHIQQHRDSLANAAHELRTPLAAIRSSIEVSLNEERTAAEYKELLENVIEECAALETLVNQLLLLADTEADRIKIAGNYVDLHNVVIRSVDMFQGVADFKHIDLVLDPPEAVLVEGNRHHLRQLLNNLIDNALKWTPAGGQVRVTLTCDSAERQAVLTVRDTGFGISPEELPLIFDRFYRGDRARRRDEGMRGTGLGLPICQAVVNSHGGTIRATSEVGKGTELKVTLPLLAPEQLAAARAQHVGDYAPLADAPAKGS